MLKAERTHCIYLQRDHWCLLTQQIRWNAGNGKLFAINNKEVHEVSVCGTGLPLGKLASKSSRVRGEGGAVSTLPG